jgi:quercetin dioxygenase-like cupin family protein
LAATPYPDSERPQHGTLRRFDLKGEVERLRGQKEWQQGRRNALTLHKGRGLSVVLLAMRAGDGLEEHSAPGAIALSVREGRIRFKTAGEEVEAGPETVLTCEAGVRHTVEALSEAVCLLSIATAR